MFAGSAKEGASSDNWWRLARRLASFVEDANTTEKAGGRYST